MQVNTTTMMKFVFHAVNTVAYNKSGYHTMIKNDFRILPLDYNFIFTCVNMCGNMTQVREILLRLMWTMFPVMCSIQILCYLSYTTCVVPCILPQNSHAWKHICNYGGYHYFMCVYPVAITQ